MKLFTPAMKKDGRGFYHIFYEKENYHEFYNRVYYDSMITEGKP